MSWLIIILISYFVLSISNLVDKIFLSKIVTASTVYAVWVSLMSVFLVGIFVTSWFLDPGAYAQLRSLGGLTFMTPGFIIISIIVGLLFTISIYLLYTALQKGEASRIIPLIGGSMPILIYCMTFFYEPLSNRTLEAFIFLVIGTILISLVPKTKQNKARWTGVSYALGASFSFALFFVLTQYIFRHHGFINGIVWPRLGTALALIVMFFYPSVRKQMRHSLAPLSIRLRTIWLSTQTLGALGFLGQAYAISIPGVSVALVSALQSIQYAFILIFATGLSLSHPKLLREFISPMVIMQKILAFVCIGIGLYFIAT